MKFQIPSAIAIMTASAVALSACTTTSPVAEAPAATTSAVASVDDAAFEADRQAILAMAGNYHVKFDFLETVPFVAGYELKDRFLSGGHEVVRVIEDRGDFISLQHILVVGGEQKFPVKHWRQDWVYEPAAVLTFIGGNAWEMRAVDKADRKGAWAQVVYQVDDSPRYGAVGKWDHSHGISQWTPPHEWRPLPRRDMTKRDDYHAVDALNRHAITPTGWVHEQDNAKLILSGESQVLVREIGVNTYTHSDAFDIAVADDYWAATKGYWAAVRAEWTALEDAGMPFGLTLKGESTDLYTPLLALATAIKDGEKTEAAAVAEARAVIARYTTTDLPALQDRLRSSSEEEAY